MDAFKALCLVGRVYDLEQGEFRLIGVYRETEEGAWYGLLEGVDDRSWIEDVPLDALARTPFAAVA